MRPESVLAALLFLHAQEPTPAPQMAGEAPAADSSPRTEEGRRIKEPKKTKNVDPKWPENALRAGLNGRVTLECTIGTDGRVEKVTELGGFHSLTEAAKEAVRKWQYTPTELDGKPVPVIMTVTVNFVLRVPPKRGDAVGSLRDPDPEIRWAAVKWLGRLRPVSADQRRAIDEALKDADERVRQAASEALARIEAR